MRTLALSLALVALSGGCTIEPKFRVDPDGDPKPDADTSNPDAGPGAPTVTITAISPSPSNMDGFVVEWSSPDQDIEEFRCALSFRGSTTEEVACVSPLAAQALAEDGTYTFVVVAVDQDGNRSAPATADYVLDRVPPETQIAGFVSSPDNSMIEFSFAAIDPATSALEINPTFFCTLDDQAENVCPANHTVMVSNGSHTLRVRASDQAGNFDQSPAVFNWNAGDPPPVITFLDPTPAENAVKSPYVGIGFTVDGGTVAGCKLDGVTVPCESGLTSSFVLPGGRHSYTVDAVGAGGTTSRTTRWAVACPPVDMAGAAAWFNIDGQTAAGETINNTASGTSPGRRGDGDADFSDWPSLTTTGRTGDALSFDGDDVLEWTDTYTTKAMTFEAWVNVETVSSTMVLAAATLTDLAGMPTEAVTLTLDRDGSGGDGVVVTLTAVPPAVSSAKTLSFVVPAAPGWRHVVASFVNEPAPGNLRLFVGVDGQYFQSSLLDAEAVPTTVVTKVQWGDRLVGQLDELAWFPSAKDESWVRSRYCPATAPEACTAADYGSATSLAQSATSPDFATSVQVATAVNGDVDVVVVDLRANFGVFAGGSIAPGTYALNGNESQYATCGACVTVVTGLDPVTFGETAGSEVYMATAGWLTIHTVFPTITGTLENATFQPVVIDRTSFISTPLNNGCDAAVRTMSINAPVNGT